MYVSLTEHETEISPFCNTKMKMYEPVANYHHFHSCAVLNKTKVVN